MDNLVNLIIFHEKFHVLFSCPSNMDQYPHLQANIEPVSRAISNWLEEKTILEMPIQSKSGKVEFAKRFLASQIDQIKQRCSPPLLSLEFLLDSSPSISLKGYSKPGHLSEFSH